MCILVILRERVAGHPLLIGANRDEFRDRPWRGPTRSGSVLAPRDLRAGGTWIACHDRGLLVALTNRPETDPDPSRPSRGLLVLDLARTGDLATARVRLEEELRAARRNAFQVLLATAREAHVAAHPGPAGTPCEWAEVGPGLHTLTNRRWLDELDAAEALAPVDVPQGTPLPEAVAAMTRVLATHEGRGPGGRDAICKHGTERGTLCSSVIALPASDAGAAPVWRFAPGAPCETEYAPVE